LTSISQAATFDWVADRYDRHAALEQEVGRRLLERLDHRRRDPECILDLGCGTGTLAAELKRRFRRAQVVGLDVSPAMLARTRRKSRLIRPLRAVCGRLESLPFPDRSADLVVSNLALMWAADPLPVFKEIGRVLRPDGLLLFTTLGAASLEQLRAAWSAVDQRVKLPPLADLLELGDALMAAGFREPVMDREMITLEYPCLEALARELEATGAATLIENWGHWQSAAASLEAAYRRLQGDAALPLGFEVIYGTAFGPPEGQPRKTAQGDVVTVSVDSLLRSRRMGYD
jgi:malonyl-CoA O-methyltransferase